MNIARTLVLPALAALCATQAALAVQPSQSSGTAEIVCAYRGIGAQNPDPKLRNPDYLADKLCFRPAQWPADYAGVTAMIRNNPETFAAYYMINVRTLYMDAALKRAAESGATQVVILGAGFDSRAYRFRDAYPKLRFFEVDLPPTSENKQRRVSQLLGKLPDNVRYAPIDFDRERLEDVLPRLGYDPKQRTFFLIEGVLMYVVDAGNSATFKFIRGNSAPGSVVVFDYLLRDVVEGRYEGYYGASSIAAAVARRGEPYVTGWMPDEAAAYLKRHGLVVVEDVGDADLVRRHLTGSDGKPDGRLLNWQRIIEATVP